MQKPTQRNRNSYTAFVLFSVMNRRKRNEDALFVFKTEMKSVFMYSEILPNKEKTIPNMYELTRPQVPNRKDFLRFRGSGS